MNAMLDRARRKRGIVLLVVISLLTLFILLGVTYTLVATQYRDSASSEARRELYGDDPETEMDLVIGQLLYDTLVRTSLQGQSVLGDMYGNDGVAVRVTAATEATSPANSGIVTLYIDDGVFQPFGRSLSDRYDYYNGRVLTFTTGAAQGISTRIMHYTPAVSGSPASVVVETLEGVQPHQVASVTAAPPVESLALINGAPFNGTGVGFEDASKNLELKDPYFNQLVALMPHFAGYRSTALTHPVNYGGEDETYDAPDLQNFFLAMVPPRSSQTNLSTDTTTHIQILPSFHRPELVRYWANQSSSPFDISNAEYRDFRRQIIARPMPWDHPRFSGSNPNYAAPSGDAAADDSNWLNVLMSKSLWDVDNDGDGVPESIWIDPGLPVLTAPNGKRYKRLVAVLIKDMDGRVNLSTAGNLKIAQENNYYLPDTQVSGQFAGQDPNAPSNVRLPRGVGYGQAEIDFRRILVGAGDASNHLSIINARYGQESIPQPGRYGTDDTLSTYKTFGVPSDHTAPTYSSYLSSPPDVWGRSVVALDYYGMPVWGNQAGSDERTDDPYEMQVDSRTAYDDAPYTPAELERLLRFNDPDSPMISSRLNLAPFNAATAAGAVARESVTTASWRVTAPSMVPPKELRTTSSTNVPIQGTILDLYAKKGLTDPNAWLAVVPFEIRHGEPFNINRPFGNGEDGNGNNIVDEPGENEPANYSFLNDSPIDDPANPYATRQMFARHLYCLAMLLKNPDYQYDLDGDGTPTPDETAKAIAQWAINVVDFRDADCIMTPFVYDPNPFDGWTANSTIDAGTTNVVWGVERPELLITEAIAWHDRRTEDTDDEEPDGKTTTESDPDDRDEDFDQRLRPRGALFIELYNPWFDRSNGINSHRPNELYLGGEGVVLNAAVGGSPTWRLIVDRRDEAARSNQPSPDYPRPESLSGPASGNGDIERSIYFRNPGGSPAVGGVNFYTSVADIAPLKPGRYAMVGSSGMANAGTYNSYVGRIQNQNDRGGDPLDMASTRQIQLQPNANPETHQVRILNNGNAYDQNDATNIQPAIAIPIDQPRSLSITEPPNGYTGAGYASPPSTVIDDETGAYEPPLDDPLDKDRVGFEFLMEDATRPNFRTIHLQRLANPLLPHDPYSNPYITIDSSSVDVTAFNGVSDPSDPGADGGGPTNFQTFQRGGSFPASDTGGYPGPGVNDAVRNIWKREDARGAPSGSSTPEAGTAHYFGYQLFHTFGYLNRMYHPYFDASGPAVYRGAPSWQDSGGGAGPAFPWLTFNNRPFNNPMELMLVPSRSQYDLLTYFSVKTPNMTKSTYGNDNENEPFGHLLNLFQTSTNPTVSAGMQLGPQLNRLLDYVEVPSPFVDTERWYPLSSFTTTNATNPTPAQSYRPPFSRLSRHREPGWININTIADDYIFTSAVSGIPETQASAAWQQVVLSRQGYGNTPFENNPAYPSYFSQPFRTADAADLNPLPSLRVDSVHATLLRKQPSNNNPLFEYPATQQHENAERNPYFRYQGFQKIGNTFTTHSNVFAVWLTMGYFEVEPIDPATYPNQSLTSHPDGYQLGMELGADTGEIRRHRAFFIIDRSIPVAYQPGQRHNTDRAVLLRRFIE